MDRRVLRLGLAVAVLMAGAISARPQSSEQPAPESKVKLYLKDGSYQLVKSYQVEGDRVRYYSLERSEWEEIPKSLVDFNATHQAEEHEKQVERQQVEEARKLESERFTGVNRQGYQLAPGIRLPTDAGIYAFDGTRAIRLEQSSGAVVKDKKRMALLMAMSGPLLKSRAVVELDGAKSPVRVETERPVFYVELSDLKPGDLLLVPLRSTRHSRIVEKIQMGVGLGKSGEIREAIPVARTEVAPGIYKLAPQQPLAPGEYALGELLGQKLNLDVWDFGIDAPGAEAAKARSAASTSHPPRL